MKRLILSIIAVFITWQMLDFIIHGVILGSSYQATAELWRPMEEMKMWLLYVAGIVSSIVFVLIYYMFFARKNIRTAVIYGLLFGVGTGFSMGYGTYAVMPITYKIAIVWFIGAVVEATAGGLVMGLIIKDQKASK